MIKERIKGSLIGCAYGDAMGMPTENMTRESILLLHPQGIKSFFPSFDTGDTGRSFLAGEITDDTIHTMILLDCLVKNKGKPKAELYITELRNWMKDHPEQNEVIVGRSTRRAMEAMDRGEDLAKTGLWGTTNGASMKMAPIGMISDYTCMKALVENVYEICYPTHNTQIALQGASVVAALVSYAIQGGNVDGIWEVALQAIEAANEKGFRLGGPKLTRRMMAVKHDAETKPEEEVIELLADFYGTGLETIETIPVILAILQLSKGYPIRAGQIAASLGGDTDTIGAIACAIAGAIHPAFPDAILFQLESVNCINFDRLTESIMPYVVQP